MNCGTNFYTHYVEVWEGQVISPRTLLGMWLHAHAGIEINAC